MSSNDILADRRRQLAERMLRGEAKAATAASDAVCRRAETDRVPLSPAQRQVWLHAGMAPDVPIYNESITFHRRGSFDLGTMQAAVDALLERHESWRTSIVLDGAEPIQVIHPALHLPLALDDVSHLPTARRDAAATAIATRDARRPIDLMRAPLLRARIVRLADDDHRLYLTLHHIIFDGVAIYRVVLPELAKLYEAFSARLPSPLPPPAIGYGDYAVWAAARTIPTAPRDHWQSALTNFPGKLELAADRPPPAFRSHAGSMEIFHLPLALTEALMALARQADATLYMTLLASFTALLHLHTGAEDITVGGVTDLRRRPELDSVVGYFLNTLPLRTHPSAAMPFLDHLRQVRETVLGALAASEMPFDEIVRTAGVDARPGEHPLFDILFSVEPPVERFPHGWDLTQMDVVVGGAKFDLYLELDERPDGIAARFLYSTERFDPATIRRMIDHWQILLQRAAASPACPLGDLLLSAAPSRPLIGPALPKPLDGETVPARIAVQARAAPDAIAISCGDEQWSYAILDRTADRLAIRLHAAGFGSGTLVAVVLERSPMLIAALLGILRAGAAYLPLDPRQPVARLRQIAQQARIDGVLTERALVGLIADVPGPVVLTDTDDEQRDAPTLPAAPGPRDLAYVLYTSGSTGEPKGVEIEHGALANLLASMAEQPGFTAADRLLAVTTVTFDIAALELFLPLVCGGEVVLAPHDTARDPALLRQLLASSRPTVMQATPAAWTALLETGWSGQEDLRILCGGEAMSRTLADRLLPCGAAVWNLYGPTETCIWSTLARIEPGEATVPIGTAVASTTLHVLDPRGRAVPADLPGELYIGGAGLARGYRGRPDLTAERFRPAPTGSGERLYRTGARVRAIDGALIHLGRTDEEEKIRGFRVAVQEVEGTLTTHSQVGGAAVRSWPDAAGSRALAAYIVCNAGDAPSPRELATFLAKRLPDYMVPSSFTILPRLPLTTSGKLDRKALPRPAIDQIDAEFSPLQTDTEVRLAAIWSELLGVGRIGRDDSFFDLGGHSLLAARLLARVSREWQRQVTMPMLLRARRLGEMAVLLTAEQPETHHLIAIQPRGWRPPLLWVEPGPSFIQLAERIGRDQPLLGVPLEPAQGAAGARDFRDHARELVKAIRWIQPDGPYYLGGWCNAGILTYAAAAQMEAEGDDIRLLILGDAFNPARPPPVDRRLSFRLRFHLEQLFGRGAGNRSAYVRERRERLLQRLGLRAPPPHWSQDEARAAVDRAVANYRPDRFGGPVLLFQSQDPFTTARMDEQWRDRLVGPVTYRQFPGSHDTLLYDPHLGAVARLLREALVRAQGERQLQTLRVDVGRDAGER